MSLYDIVGEALNTVRKSNGIYVTYRRGAQFFKINAMVGRTDFFSAEVQAVTTDTRSRDYLISADELNEKGIAEPKLGDKIVERIGSTQFTYTVTPFVGGQPWRYSDSGQTQMRIHTQLTGTAEV